MKLFFSFNFMSYFGPDGAFIEGTLITTGSSNLDSGSTYQINNVDVLTSNTLGSGVTSSSLTSVGTLTGLNVSGNVGIGISNPISSLDVNVVGRPLNIPNQAVGSIGLGNATSVTNQNLPTILAKTNTSNLAGLGLIAATPNLSNNTADMTLDARTNTNTDFSAGVLTSPAFQFRRFNNPLVSILRNGNVGIGVTNPEYRLDIGQNTSNVIDEVVRIRSRRFAGLQIEGDSADLSGEPGGAYLRLLQDGGNTGGVIGLLQGNGQDGIGGSATDTLHNALYISSIGGTTTFSRIQFGTNNTARMTIDSLGNIGIGTTNPTQRLDVNGSINFTGSLLQNGTPFGGSSQWTTSGSNIHYTTGNVGIGVTNPSQRLQVDGNIKTDSGEFFQNNVSIGFGSSTVTDITSTSLNPDKLYNFITSNTTTTDVRTTEWATRIESGEQNFDDDMGYNITTDSNGNVYVVGVFLTSTINIYNKDGTIFKTLDDNNQNSGIFLVKYNELGVGQWATQISRLFYSGFGIIKNTASISTDLLGNVYVTGGLADFDSAIIYNSDDTTFATLANNGSYAAFVVKYNTSGFGQWATRIDGPIEDVGYGIASDPLGNVYVTGLSYGATVFNANGTTFATLANNGSYATFVVKYNTSGFAQWVTRIDGPIEDEGYDITVDTDGNVYVTGFSYGSTVFNADGTTFATLENNGSYAAFVVKYNTSGFGQWATRIDGPGEERGFSITTDLLGNVYVTGGYTNTTTIFNSDGTTFGTLSNNGAYDAFIVKYNTLGIGQWATRIVGSSIEKGYGIATDSNGNVYVTGYYGSSSVTIFNPNGTTFGTLENFGNGGTFVVKYNDYILNDIPYELALLANTPLNQGRVVTVINKTKTPSKIKLLNDPPQEVSIAMSEKFIYYDNKWYPNGNINSSSLVGMVSFFASSLPPTGWLVCNGSAISRTIYANLFTAIGTTFGIGNGSTTFNLPDLRGEFIRGWDSGRGVDTGRTFGSAQSHAMQRLTGKTGYVQRDYNARRADASGVFVTEFSSGATDSGRGSDGVVRFDFDSARQTNTATETRPKNIALLPCVKF